MALDSFTLGGLRALFTVLFVLVGFLTLKLTMSRSSIHHGCTPAPLPLGADKGRAHRPSMLIWFWPEGNKFDFAACRKYFGIDGCRLTDDRSLYKEADNVLIFHKGINEDLSNMPRMPRPGFQRWIWMNLDPPENTRRINGLDKLFNLSLTFRQDSDIQVRWRLMANRDQSSVVSLPNKEHLVCWVDTGSTAVNRTSYRYYEELVKHVDVHVVRRSPGTQGQDHLTLLGRCRFVLAFEDFVYRDYITERFHAPLAAGSVPVALGPPRQNYEDFAPGESFIHVNDFAGAQSLAEHLRRVGGEEPAYMRYFQWRRAYSAERYFSDAGLQHLKAICLACDHVAKFKVFRTIPNLYKWYFAS